MSSGSIGAVEGHPSEPAPAADIRGSEDPMHLCANGTCDCDD